MFVYRARYNTKENRIPLGKKKENLEKNGVLIKSKLRLIFVCVILVVLTF